MDALLFQLAGQRFGIPVADVIELLPAIAITALPRAPAVVEGCINVRGLILPVFDIRAVFGLAARAATHSEHFVVARSGVRHVAIRTDRALDVISIEEAALHDAQTLARTPLPIGAVAKLAGGLVFIHDLHGLLSAAEEASLSVALASGGST